MNWLHFGTTSICEYFVDVLYMHSLCVFLRPRLSMNFSQVKSSCVTLGIEILNINISVFTWSRWSFSVRASFKLVSRENPDRNTQRPREHLSCLLLIYYQDTADNDSHQLSDLHQTVSETLNLSVLSCRLRNIWTNRELLRQPTTSQPKLAVTSWHSVAQRGVRVPLKAHTCTQWTETHSRDL